MTDQPYSSADQDPQGSFAPPQGDTPAGPTGGPAPAAAGPETTLWTGRTHLHHYLGRIALGVLISAVVVWLIVLLASNQQWAQSTIYTVAIIIIVPVMLCTLGSALYHVLKSRYRLTGQRLFIERGILSQTIDQTELIRVDDVRVHKRLIDRILGMGTVEIRSTDATDSAIRIEGIKNADQVAEMVRNSMRSLRNKSLFVENL